MAQRNQPLMNVKGEPAKTPQKFIPNQNKNKVWAQKSVVEKKVDLNKSKDLNVLANKDGDSSGKKAIGRSRLFIGNLNEETTEDALKKILEKYGSITELYVNSKRGFAFVKFNSKASADAAKDGMDMLKLNNRTIRVRYAAHGAAIRVKNLSPYVSNELLEQAFGSFGSIERAIHIVDDRGRPVGEGIVEFSKKMSSQAAMKKCSDGCFVLGTFPKPVIVEQFEQNDEDEGLPEKNVLKNQKYHRDRENMPRMLTRGSFEFEYASRWKELFNTEKEKKEALEREMNETRKKLEDQMEFALHEQETNMLREQLRIREQEASQLLMERERREEMNRRNQQMRQDDMFNNSLSDIRVRPNMNMNDDRRGRADGQMDMMHDNQRNGNKHENRSGNNRNIPGNSPMDSQSRSMQGGMGSMQNSPSPLVGAPVPPAELLNAGAMPMRQSRFEQAGYSGKGSPQGDMGFHQGSPRGGPMDRNNSRGSHMGGGMQRDMGPPFKRLGPSNNAWEDKRRRF